MTARSVPRWLVVAGLIVLPLAVLVTLPARVALAPFDLPGAVGMVQGTVWSGTAHWQQPGFAPLAVSWRWTPPASWQWEAADGDSTLTGTLRPGGRELVLTGLRGDLALARVDLDAWLPDTRPLGRLQADITELRLGGREPPSISGRVLWTDAALAGAVEARLGTIELVLESGERVQTARFRSLEAAEVQVHGRIELDRDRYDLDARLTPRADDPELARQLAWLGEAESDGSVRIRFSGYTGW